MRRLLLILLLLVAIVVAAGLIAPFFIPAEAWRGRIESAASQALGRDVEINGEIDLAFIPRVQVKAGDVVIANAEGFGEEPFAQMEQLRLAVELMPLIQREFVIEEFILVDPVIRLMERGGRNNWRFGGGEDGAAPSRAQAQEGFRHPGALPLEGSFGDVRIENGTLIYVSGDTRREFNAVDLAASLPGVDQPVGLEGGFSLNERRMDFSASLGSLRGFFEGARTPASLTLSGPPGNASFEGHVLESAVLEYAGQSELALDLPELAAALGTQMGGGQTFRRFDASGRLSGAPGVVSLNEADLTFDDIAAAGGLELNYGASRPRLTGDLDIPELDLNPYLGAGGGEGGDGLWSEEPLDLSGLDVLDARLTGRTDRLVVREMELTDAGFEATLENGRLQAVFPQFTLYNGRGNATVVLSGRGARPSLGLNGQLDTLQILPFLRDLAGFERLRGLGTVSLDVSGSGQSPAALMNALDGEGRFDLADGAIVGVNIAGVIRGILTALETGELPDAFGERQTTDFSALRGTVAIENGIARNSDLVMLSPLIRMTGDGQVDLGGRSLDYRVTPRAVASLTGQSGEVDLQGIPIPINIAGSLTDPAFRPDYAAIARALMQARAQGQLSGLGQALDLERLREEGPQSAVNILSGMLGRTGQTGEDAAGAIGEVAGEALGEEEQTGTEAKTGEEETEEEPSPEDVIGGILGAAREAAEEEEEQDDGQGGGG